VLVPFLQKQQLGTKTWFMAFMGLTQKVKYIKEDSRRRLW
jgi:hypothetical protein